MTDMSTNVPAHQRLQSFGVRHLHNITRKCWALSQEGGFDLFRDERTKTKEALCTYMLGRFTGAEIDAAHDLVRSEYPKGNGKRWKFKARGDDSSQSTESGSTSQSSTENSTQQTETAKPVPVPVVPATGDAGDLGRALAGLLGGALVPQLTAIIEQEVGRRVDALRKEMHELASTSVRPVELKRADLPPVKLGVQHKSFELLLKACNARMRDGHRLNIWLAGPAGTGKTHAARAVSKALEIAFQFNGAIDNPYKLIGFRSATGETVRTPFREAWEHGGVYLFDEVDASSPSAILEFNAALSNGVCAFPDKVVERHPDCIVIAGANTTGLGASMEYVGRMKQDAAFLDRFAVIHWELDADLEASLCANDAWRRRVVSVRGAIKSRGIKGAMVTPRATFYGEALLAAGIDMADVERMTLRKGIADDLWQQIR
jgi:cobaltochelatase CobS